MYNYSQLLQNFSFFRKEFFNVTDKPPIILKQTPTQNVDTEFSKKSSIALLSPGEILLKIYTILIELYKLQSDQIYTPPTLQVFEHTFTSLGETKTFRVDTLAPYWYIQGEFKAGVIFRIMPNGEYVPSLGALEISSGGTISIPKAQKISIQNNGVTGRIIVCASSTPINGIYRST